MNAGARVGRRDTCAPGSPVKCALIFISLFLLFPTLCGVFSQGNGEDMPHHEVESWAQQIGSPIFHLLNTVSKYSDIEENFRTQGAIISENDGLTLVKQMAEDVTNMMRYKVQAVKRIMNVAEEVSQDPSYLQDEWRGYYNAKIVNQQPEHIEALEERYSSRMQEYYGTKFKELFTQLDMTPNSHFDGEPVSLNVSTVHVPTNVFEGSPHVRKAIRWSEALEKTFYSNYEHDPSLSWQYFGSSTGFLRQFPGSSWQMDADDPDLYDSRLRSWYIQAANTPKDMVILLDISGSMTGLRKEIARHVVLNILETLNDNDFVNVFVFSEDTVELVPCFNDTLVQANPENLGEFKGALNDLKTKDIANFSLALTKAFKLLQKHNKIGHGSQCNQAIMLVTDGAPYTYDQIFNEFNWPQLQIRLFTYLIGREVTEIRNLCWMACANKGYFAHVTTPSEVREQVLKYIPVVARPMVMYQKEHPIVWTGVYADIADPKQTHWLWELRERDRQMRKTNNYRKLKRIVETGSKQYVMSIKDKNEVKKFLLYGDFGLSDREVARIKAERAHRIRGRSNGIGTHKGYRLMTTVSVPVFNRTQSVERVADLLGVAGADVPIREIQKLVPPYKLGVNGYSFMVNKNGYVVYHPDLRPTFQGILKPNYNSVDLSEVELVDVSEDPRYNHSELNTLRRDMIEQRSSEAVLKVRVHLDDLKRVLVRDQRYFTSKVSDTPFSLGISIPQGYGKYKVVGQIELSLAMKDDEKFNASNLLGSGNWSLHPEWVYCEYKYDQGVDRTPEELMLHFLDKAQQPGWKWRSTRTRPPPDSTLSKGHQSHYDEADYYCDKNLVQSLLFDAKATDVYNKTNKKGFGADKNQGKHKNFGITTAFVATRSGLSRWVDVGDNMEPTDAKPHFMELHDKAIDEVWYKRAVDYYNEDPDAYVYTVPFDAATRDPSEVFVTATRAIYIRQNKFQQAPAAVVGVNIKLDKFVEFFKNETYNCREFSMRQSTCNSEKTCKSDLLDCYLLDDNGFVVASEKSEETGKFFGEIEGTILDSLVQSDVYNRVKIYDYQGVCLDGTTEGSFASILLTPIQILRWAANWFLSNLMWLMVKTQLYQLWDPNAIFAQDYDVSGGVPYPEYEGRPPLPPIHPPTFAKKLLRKPRKIQQNLDELTQTIQEKSNHGQFTGETKSPLIRGLENMNENDEEYKPPEGVIKLLQKSRKTTRSTDGIQSTGEESYLQNKQPSSSEISPEDTDFQLPEQTTTTQEHQPTEDQSIGEPTNLLLQQSTEDQSITSYSTSIPVEYDSTSLPVEYEVEFLNNSSEIIEELLNKTRYNEVTEESKQREWEEEYYDILYDMKYEENENDTYDNYEEEEKEEEGFPSLKLAYINKTRPRPCDKEVHLYKLNQSKLKQSKTEKYKPVKGKLSNCHSNGCGKPFSVQKVIQTNLVLVVVNNLCPCESRMVSIEPTEVPKTNSSHCERLLMKHFRERPSDCFNYHPDESLIDDCGGCNSLRQASLPVLLVLALLVYSRSIVTT